MKRMMFMLHDTGVQKYVNWEVTNVAKITK